MDTLDFLKRVLPSEGVYVTTVINPDARRQGYFTDIEELAVAVIRLDETGNNTYYAISSFKEKGNRKQENVHLTQVVAIDVDCGPKKPFPSWKEGLQALGKFVDEMGLPAPMIVHSGNGLHVYWCLEEPATPDEWKPVATAMKSAAIEKQFAIDAGLTANNALVLRPIGTHNPKNGKEVKLLLDAERVPLRVLKDCLVNYVDHKMISPEATTSTLLQNLAVKQDFPPTNAGAVLNKCQQIKWAVENQEEVPEPLWYDLIGVAAYCHDAEEVAIKWSEKHPSYDQQATISKLNHWKENATGPTTCAKFEADRAGGCKGCKFKDKIGSPARLGVQYEEVGIAADALDGAAKVIPLPKPFKRTDHGIKITIDDTDIDICPFDIYPVSYGKDESLGYEVCRYHWKRPHVGWQPLVLRQAYLTDGSREFPNSIADQGIVLNNKRQTEYFQYMLRSYMEQLRQARTLTNMYASMGWKNNYSEFVIGDMIVRRNSDGTVTEEKINLTSTTQRIGSDFYGTQGTAEEWAEFSTLLDKANLPAHIFTLGVSFSAPLYVFTGLKGSTISLCGETGGGKSLAQFWAQSIWGVPEKLHFAAKYTQNTLFSRFGLYCHMPLTIDEATMMPDKEVGDFLYWISQGRDKARLNRNAEERDAKEFAAPAIVSTNKSFASKLVASGLETTAQLARLLEVQVPAHPLFRKDSSAGRQVYAFVNTHYGCVGHEFIKKLLELGPDAIKAMINEAYTTFHKKYGSKFAGEERYWEQTIVLADVALRLAKEWGLIKCNVENGISWVLNQIGVMRKISVETQLDSFDLLSEFLNDHAGMALTMIHNGTTKPSPDYNHLPRSELRVRFDLYRKDSTSKLDRGTIMLDKVYFRKWLASKGVDFKVFLQEINDQQINATPASGKSSLGRDSPIKLPQTYVVGVNLNHPRLQGILEDADEAVDNLTYGQLKVV
jgi:hypothetical protein